MNNFYFKIGILNFKVMNTFVYREKYFTEDETALKKLF